jgi:hypothetical protein
MLKGGDTKGLWSSVWLLVRDFVMRGAGVYLFRLFAQPGKQIENSRS